ncbi:hypothetical protein OOT46_04180 [Aquabacterium sp. A7-Y]|uniref:hypothetical protein n=1 Tax=Aquabacterium sp. A7-Y TaxID=1349605 RepID=UPI00223C9597|nr:hypothetical protein [Aquabacterium sp. A7-Y]MCW7537049.1 hypothetical protein [Aquabacterium sp. A7-Y]
MQRQDKQVPPGQPDLGAPPRQNTPHPDVPQVDLSVESVAGEEDPGAGMDMSVGQGGLTPGDVRALHHEEPPPAGKTARH